MIAYFACSYKVDYVPAIYAPHKRDRLNLSARLIVISPITLFTHQIMKKIPSHFYKSDAGYQI